MTTVEIELKKLREDREIFMHLYFQQLHLIYSVNKEDYLGNPELCRLRWNVKQIDEILELY